jgi:hypothetical protein
MGHVMEYRLIIDREIELQGRDLFFELQAQALEVGSYPFPGQSGIGYGEQVLIIPADA